MKVLSLFDGIACGYEALKRANINVDAYYASEIDKYAISVAEKNHPDIIQLGDVSNWKDWNIDFSEIDIVIGGSPCFEEGTMILCKEGYKDIKDVQVGDEVLTHKNRYRKVVNVGSRIALTVELTVVGATSTRVTLNHPYYVMDANSNSGEVKFKIVSELADGDRIGVIFGKDMPNIVMWLPFKGISNLLEDRVVYNIEVEEDHTYTANNAIVHNCQGFTWAGKKLNFEDERSKLFFEFSDIVKYVQSKNSNMKFLLENVKMEKKHRDVISEIMGVEPVLINSNCFSAQNRQRYYWFNWELSTDGLIPNDVMLKDIVREEDNGNENVYISKQHYNAWLKSYPNWTACELDGKAKPLLATYFKQPPHCPYIQYRYEDEDSEKENANKYSIYRRLSPIECERLQTISDNYTEEDVNGKKLSYTQRWKMLGNAWTVDVISYILKGL